MHILVTGASGLLGSSLIPTLQADGHTVLRLRRGAAADRAAAHAAAHASADADPVWDPAAGVLEAAPLEGLDVVIHLAGENVGGGRWTAARKKRIEDSRVLGTRLLANTLAKLQQPPRVLVCASAVGYYGDRGDQELEETAVAGTGFLAEVGQRWEVAAAAATAAGIRTVHLRFGVVLSTGDGALAKMLPAFRAGVGGALGNGRQFMSWIHIDDTIAIVRHAMENEALHGPVNAVAPHAVRNSEFTKTLGRVLGRPTFLPVPAWAVRLLFGEMGDALLLASTRATPSVLLRSGYTFQYPELEAALNDLLG